MAEVRKLLLAGFEDRIIALVEIVHIDCLARIPTCRKPEWVYGFLRSPEQLEDVHRPARLSIIAKQTPGACYCSE